jgi:hypothetical protein
LIDIYAANKKNNSGKKKGRKKCWENGMLEKWDVGKMGCWKNGDLY